MRGIAQCGRVAATVLLAVSVLTACVTLAEPNKPLPPQAAPNDGHAMSGGGYRLGNLNEDGLATDSLILVSFSGGGKRSSAFGYGALRGLHQFMIPVNGVERPMLDQVDFISSVSGGSFPAAYYGLYRDRIFTDFERDFLRQDIESYIWGTYLLPWHAARLFAPGYGTNDRMAEVYDDLMFHGATYADLLRNGRPLVSIDATDVDYGAVFPFTQDQFDLICSDLTQYPLARAVAASNGFPVLFSPITLKSYAGNCGLTPEWMKREQDNDPLSRRRQLEKEAQLYLDSSKTKYVHLLDGGIADNLAMRNVINAMLILDSDERTLQRMNAGRIRRLVLISVDGQAATDSSGAREPALTGLGRTLSVVSGTQIDRYNFETEILARDELEKLGEKIKEMRCRSGVVVGSYRCDDVETYFIHLSLEDVSDPVMRQHLESTPTGLTLPDADIDALVKAGDAVVRASPELDAFRRSLSGTLPSSSHAAGANSAM